MREMPPRTMYHRLLGWHAPSLRRFLVVATIGLAVAIAVQPFAPWQLALLNGWDAATASFLLAVWPIIARADGTRTQLLANREDQTRTTAGALLLGASVASLLGVGFALGLAGQRTGLVRALLIGSATLTVILAWCLLNTVFTLRYVHQYFTLSQQGIDFGRPESQVPPSYRDFAYLAFTIGMTYQVSDTAVPDPRIRRTVLWHALLSYLYGVVIVAGAVNLIAGLVK
jgi:uncharacterized membrane protein